MRIFYLFKIKNQYATLTKKHPYNLYKTIEQIYRLTPEELTIATNIFDQISDTFNKEKINKKIYDSYKEQDTYTNYLNTHIINDYFTKEQTKLIVNKSYMLIKSTKQIPLFLKEIKSKDNIFICDFQNKAYFWLEQIA